MSEATLFHSTHIENLEAILREGLLAAKSEAIECGIFLTNVKPVSSENFVAFEIDARGLELDEDWTTAPDQEGERWFVVYDDIPPSQIVAAHVGSDRKLLEMSENAGQVHQQPMQQLKAIEQKALQQTGPAREYLSVEKAPAVDAKAAGSRERESRPDLAM